MSERAREDHAIAAAMLTPRQLRVLHLRDQLRYSFNHIADETGTSERHAKRIYTQAARIHARHLHALQQQRHA